MHVTVRCLALARLYIHKVAHNYCISIYNIIMQKKYTYFGQNKIYFFLMLLLKPHVFIMYTVMLLCIHNKIKIRKTECISVKASPLRILSLNCQPMTCKRFFGFGTDTVIVIPFTISTISAYAILFWPKFYHAHKPCLSDDDTCQCQQHSM